MTALIFFAGYVTGLLTAALAVIVGVLIRGSQEMEQWESAKKDYRITVVQPARRGPGWVDRAVSRADRSDWQTPRARE